MDSQIYLLLIRSSGDYTDWEEELSTVNELTAPILSTQLLTDMIMGDSLDAPFMQFIRVSNLTHSLSFGDSSNFADDKGALEDTWSTKFEKAAYSPNPYLRGQIKRTKFYNKQKAQIMAPKRGRGSSPFHWSSKSKNQFVQSVIPEHGELTFTKYVDSATPQLAYGCAAQEKFPLAIFIYRRKMGLGIGGIRFPYFMVGAFKCKIKDWSLDGDTETVALHYRKIAWCGFLQWADTNLSLPWSNRWFDQEKYTGGQGGAATGVQLIIGGIVLLAGGILAAVEGLSSTDEGEESQLNG